MEDKCTSSLNKLQRLLGRFKLSELNRLIVLKFSSIDWEDLLQELKENREPLNSKTIARRFVAIVKEQKFGPQKIEFILNKFQVTDMSLHSERRKWRAYEMHGEPSNKLLQSSKLAEHVKRTYMTQADVPIQIVAEHRDGIYWLLICEVKPEPKRSKKKKSNTNIQRPQFKSPVYLAVPSGEPFLFVPVVHTISDTILECVGSAFNCTKVHPLPLTGNIIPELLRALRLTKSRVAGVTRRQPFQPRPAVPLPGGGQDFSQRNDRQIYVDEQFGENPPKKSVINFHASSEVELEEGEKFEYPVKVAITSTDNNVWGLMKQMIVDEVIAFPPPVFYHQALLRGRDTIKLKQSKKVAK